MVKWHLTKISKPLEKTNGHLPKQTSPFAVSVISQDTALVELLKTMQEQIKT